MPSLNNFRIKLPVSLFVLLCCVQTIVFAAEATIEEAGVVFDLPDAWTYKVEKVKIPSGELMQKWARTPIETEEARFVPGMVAVATPVPKDANLALLTQTRLSQAPYRMKVPDAECLKCVHYELKSPNGTVGVVSYEEPPFAPGGPAEGSGPSVGHSLRVNLVNLQLEPSWAFRIVKNMPDGTKMTATLIHALVDGKFLEITFWYPPKLARSLEEEIAPIISSLRKR